MCSTMRKVKYIGDAAKRIGRFGLVAPGAILKLTEDEFRGAADNPEMEVLEGRTITASRPPESIARLDWNKPNLQERLKKRSKADIDRLCRDIEAIPTLHDVNLPSGNLVTKNEQVDRLVELAETQGWTLYS